MAEGRAGALRVGGWGVVWGLGGALGEIPAARRGYDGEGARVAAGGGSSGVASAPLTVSLASHLRHCRACRGNLDVRGAGVASCRPPVRRGEGGDGGSFGTAARPSSVIPALRRGYLDVRGAGAASRRLPPLPRPFPSPSLSPSPSYPRHTSVIPALRRGYLDVRGAGAASRRLPPLPRPFPSPSLSPSPSYPRHTSVIPALRRGYLDERGTGTAFCRQPHLRRLSVAPNLIWGLSQRCSQR